MTKTWFISGASSGLGREMAQQLLARGDRVVGTARRADALAALETQYGNRLHVLTLELTDTDSIRATVGAAFDRFGMIDVVVSSAGYGLVGAAEEVTDAQIDQQIATNLVGSIQLIRAVLPHLRAQGGGRIVQVSSEGGQIAYPNFSLYHASKWGIEGFIEAVSPGGRIIRHRLHHRRTGADGHELQDQRRSRRARWRSMTTRLPGRFGKRSRAGPLCSRAMPPAPRQP